MPVKAQVLTKDHVGMKHGFRSGLEDTISTQLKNAGVEAKYEPFRIQYTQPGNPQQNAYIERYNRTVRYAWLAQTLFESIEQVQQTATRWLWTYNHERPNMALGGITPMQKLALAA